MNYRRLKRLLSQVVVVGKTKKTFWKKSKDFEMQIYYTPVKNKIMLINIEGVDIDNNQLSVTFTVGDEISLVFDWIKKNGHEITFLRNRLQN
jgi:hypothetical protein